MASFSSSELEPLVSLRLVVDLIHYLRLSETVHDYYGLQKFPPTQLLLLIEKTLISISYYIHKQPSGSLCILPMSSLYTFVLRTARFLEGCSSRSPPLLRRLKEFSSRISSQLLFLVASFELGRLGHQPVALPHPRRGMTMAPSPLPSFEHVCNPWSIKCYSATVLQFSRKLQYIWTKKLKTGWQITNIANM